jgi:hypothetical protein
MSVRSYSFAILTLPSASPFDIVAFIASWNEGALTVPDATCDDWSSSDGVDEVMLANAYRGGDSWGAFGWRCDRSLRLLCLQRGAHGPALPRKRPGTARLAFVTSATGSGYFAEWPQSGGAAGVPGADQICRTLANDADLPLPDTYKAWLSTPAADAIDRFIHDGAWFRTDGAAVAASKADLIDGVIGAPLQITERAEPTLFSTPWTGTQRNGRLGSAHCTSWTAPTGRPEGNIGFGNFGQNFAADAYWSYFEFGSASYCQDSQPLYCFADNDSLFLDGFEVQ